MEVIATHRHIGMSAQKARLVLEHLPGHTVEDALNMLKFFPSPHARLVAKIVKSAAANAENNFAMTRTVSTSSAPSRTTAVAIVGSGRLHADATTRTSGALAT